MGTTLQQFRRSMSVTGGIIDGEAGEKDIVNSF